VNEEPAGPRRGPALGTRLAIRGGALLGCLLLLATRSDSQALASLWWAFGIAGAGLAAGAVEQTGPTGFRLAGWLPRLARIGEIGLVSLAVAYTGGATSPLRIYLLAPAVVAGLSEGAGYALLPSAAAAVAAALARPVAGGGLREYALSAVAWVGLSAGAAELAWRVSRADPGAEPPPHSYAAAYRLLSQLRTVARQLSAGLDTLTLAEGVLSQVGQNAPMERGAVFVTSAGERLLELAHRGWPSGAPRTGWATELTGETPYAEAWLTQHSQTVPAQLSGGTGSGLVVPLRSGARTFGLVAIETSAASAYPPALVRQVEAAAASAALPLSSALLFDEIRELATVEERRRLAREIHDGIAQELASFGYLVDGLAAEVRSGAAPERVAGQLRELRGELSRIIGELRLSIFDLRSDVEAHGGLGAALSEYVRAVGAGSPFTVHLSLNEGPNRLPADIEAELLRIAQEAITNARKHAHAHNLWVDCLVDPPQARLRVDDDGTGVPTERQGSYGMEIMRERAARLRAQLTVRQRQPTGTSVEVVLGFSPAVATVETDRTVV
jgi:signal transduction histidine kinase